jgi:hypothetical protein
MSSLIQFVSQRRGNILAILSLTYAKGSRKIAPTKETLSNLKQRFGNRLSEFFEDCGMGSEAVDQLTNSEMLYLMKFSNIENIRKKGFEFLSL